MPRFAPPVAPKCAKCGTSVFHVEQVMGPMGKLYHKPCLACVVCNKRLDSTLLVEHDGEPYCKNCHREHLGTGKGSFNTAVVLHPISPKASSVSSNTHSPAMSSTPTRSFASPRSGGSKPLYSPRSPSPVNSSYSTGLEDEGVPVISVRSRGAPISLPASPTNPSSRQYASTRATPGTSIRSIDEAVSSRSADIRDPVLRLAESVGGINLSQKTPSKQKEEQQPSAPLPSANFYDTPSPSSTRKQEPYQDSSTPSRTTTAPSWSNDDEQAPIITTRRISAADTIGSIRLGGNQHSSPSTRVNTSSPLSAVGSLPPLRRPDPSSLTGASGTAKIAPPRMTTNPSTATGGGFGREDSNSSIGGRAKGGIERLGLGSIITDAGGGTPLCARCQKSVYFAEQKAAAGRKWHRGCLRCDGCSTTLDTGKLEEGPTDRTYENGNKIGKGGANIWCRVCYAKHFGPKNLAVGFSLPEAMS